MNVVIPISIIAFLLALLASKGRMKNGLEWCFILLAVIGAIHFDYGNDYRNYLIMFNDAGWLSFTKEDILGYFRDPGWIALCVMFRPLGFFAMIIFLNIVQNFIYYKVIKNNVERNWWWLAIFIYVFGTNLYLLNFSMMRQGLAISLIVASVSLLLKKRNKFAIILIFVATLMHSTSVIVIPFLVALAVLKNPKPLIYIYAVLFVFFVVFGSSFLSQISFSDSINQYSTMYESTSGIHLGIGFLVDIIGLIVVIYVCATEKQLQVDAYKLASFYCVSYLLIPLQSVNFMTGRIGFYFGALSIVAVPLFYGYLKSNVRVALLAVFVLITMYRYYLFFTTGAFAESYSGPFRTIFSVSWM